MYCIYVKKAMENGIHMMYNVNIRKNTKQIYVIHTVLSGGRLWTVPKVQINL